MESVQGWFHAMVLRTGFLDRYPHFAPQLARLDAVQDDTCLMAVSPGRGDRVVLHVDTASFEGRDAAFRAVLQHELHHVIAGHLDDAFRNVTAANVMQVAKEITANEHIVEPLPGTPHQWQSYAEYGIAPGQDTWQRYELLLKARDDGRWKPRTLRIRCCSSAARDGEELLADVLPEELRDLLAGRGRHRGQETLPVGAPASGQQVDWSDVLHRVAWSRVDRKQSLRRPNRSDPHCRRIGVIPGWGRRPARSRLVCAIDTSGSMDAALFPRIAAELSGLARRADVVVVECDAAIQREYAFTGVLENVRGRGGTDLRPVFASDVLARHRPDCVVYFTDGEGPFPAQNPGVHTLWVLTSRRAFACRWGHRLYIDGGEAEPVRPRLRDLVRP
jgi:predicted metal-dependent peptidase